MLTTPLCTRASLRLLTRASLTPARVLRRKHTTKSSCCSKKPTDSNSKPPISTPSMLSSAFWSSKSVWKRASINTTRCLIGCTSGDFSSMWLLQSYYPELGTPTIMGISMAAGITTSMLLETVLLHRGKDRLPWPVAAKTAAGMSLISMITMEAAENAVDFYLTGGTVCFDSPAFWAAAAASIVAGFLAPLPYNYVRLRKYGKSCH